MDEQRDICIRTPQVGEPMSRMHQLIWNDQLARLTGVHVSDNTGLHSVTLREEGEHSQCSGHEHTWEESGAHKGHCLTNLSSEKVMGSTHVPRWIQEVDQMINEAIWCLDEPTFGIGELESTYNVCQKVSTQMKMTMDIEEADVQNTECRKRLIQEVESLARKEEEHVKKLCMFAAEKDRMKDREHTNHYLNWLQGEAVLDCIHEEEMRNMGWTDILAYDKHPDYPRYPQNAGNTREPMNAGLSGKTGVDD